MSTTASSKTQPAAGTTVTHTLSLPLPKSVATRIHLHLTIGTHHILLFLTTRAPDGDSGPAALGSFVYALPSLAATQLYIHQESIDTAMRIARVISKRTGRPTYVGNSMTFGSTGLGGSVEEEMEAVRDVVDVVVAKSLEI